MALDDRYANKFVPLDSMAIYPKSGHALLYTPMTGEMKCPTSHTFALRISILSFQIVDATQAPISIKPFDHHHESTLGLIFFE